MGFKEIYGSKKSALICAICGKQIKNRHTSVQFILSPLHSEIINPQHDACNIKYQNLIN